jgi:hypothetical protein
MEFVVCAHHVLEQLSIPVGEFVIDVQISKSLTSELRQVAVDPVDDGHQRHIVISWEDPHDYDRRHGRSHLNHTHNLLDPSSNVIRPRLSVPWNG